ncbi:MAG: hypothetical protein IPL83_16370 [Bdellovibrionales bacterium]|nr:hypothetical protein [Bdellovibrionales bacterium]
MNSRRVILFGLIIFQSVIGLQAAAKKKCESETEKSANALRISSRMIRAILDDVDANYKAINGGGISKIDGLETFKYKVFLPQEERIDTITYEFKVKPNCQMKISKREEGVVTPTLNPTKESK